MNQLDFYKNELQMDYFSDSYRKFENDFYRYSALDTPLTFLTEAEKPSPLIWLSSIEKCHYRQSL